MKKIYENFTLPAPGLRRQVAEMIIERIGTWAISRATTIWGEDLSLCAPGLTKFLTLWNPTGRNALWHPAIGVLNERAVAGEGPPPLASFVEIGLQAALAGVQGQWSFQLESATTLQFEHWLLPKVKSGTVVASKGRISVAVVLNDDRSASISFARRGEDWTMVHDQVLVTNLPVIYFGDDYRITLLPDMLSNIALLPQYPGAAFEPAKNLDSFAGRLDETLTFLKNYAPAYLDWVGDVVRYILPVRSPGNLIGSSSTPGHWGLVSIANDERALVIGELLVHEASHQHFFIAANLGEIDDGSDEGLHYSRFSRRDRPIDRILLAYHALGNIALYYKDCVASGIPYGRIERRIAYITAHMNDLEEYVRNSTALTALGRSLWQPLAARTRGFGITMKEFLANKELAALYHID